MNKLMNIIFSLSISGTILIFILMIMRVSLKEKVSKTWQYYLWIIVIVRLLLPWTPDIHFFGNIPEINDNTMIQSEIVDENKSERLNLAIYSENNEYSPNKIYTEKIYSIIFKNIWFIWLLVAAMLFIRKITIYQSFVNYIKVGREEISDIKQWEHLGKLLEQKHIVTPVSIYKNELISSPLIIGFFKPCIMLPNEKLSDSEFECTILHELVHYKRKDMFYKWLVQITICIHWFNPIVYIMGKEINRICELSCDEEVIKEFSDKKIYEYGNTLIKAIRVGNFYENSLASVTLTKNVDLLKERLDAIMSFKRKNKFNSIIPLITTIILLCSFIFLGAYALENINYKKNKNLDIENMGKINDKVMYYVYTEKGLRSIGKDNNSLNGVYMLANDIVLSSKEWEPIGSKDKPFTGTFNGNGFYIKGQTMSSHNKENIGLFGYAKDALLHNIELRDLDISICAFPDNVTLEDNKAYPKITQNTKDKNKMDTFVLSGKTYYKVENETQLRLIGTEKYGLDKNYIQMKNINMSTDEWKPIGTIEHPFTGTYCGNGFEIKNITMTSPDAKVIGMFGVAEGATIYNITLRDYDISSAGKNSKTKSVSPILVFGTDCKCYDNNTYPKEP